MKDEVLNISAPKAWAHQVETYKESPYESVIKYAKRWGKLMQVEMNNCNSKILTKEIVDATNLKADNENISAWYRSCASNLLIKYWQYGYSLGLLEGFLNDEIILARRNAKTLNR